MALHPSGSGAFADKTHEFPFHDLTDGPQFGVGNIRHPLPHGRVVAAGGPCGAEGFAVQAMEFGRDPGRRVNPVRDAADRDLLGG